MGTTELDNKNEPICVSVLLQNFLTHMSALINEKISVITIYDSFRETVLPLKLRWRNREYRINKLGYYHKYKVGRTMIHAYHVTDGNLDFSLECDGDNLHWILKEVVDGNAGV